MEKNDVAQKIEALVKLQSIDTKLDEIKRLRGDLPQEIIDLEDEIQGYDTRFLRFKSEIDEFESVISTGKESIKTAEKLILKYSEQQKNVRNNREFDAINKEVEFQELEIQILQKKINNSYDNIEKKKNELEDLKSIIEERTIDLTNKKSELDDILADSLEEVEKLTKNRLKAAKKIDEKLLNYYEKLRKNLSNGLAVVTVKRGAAEGCNIVIPPQKIAEIKKKNKIVIDEHSGRILADVEVIEAVEEKPKRTSRKRKTQTNPSS